MAKPDIFSLLKDTKYRTHAGRIVLQGVNALSDKEEWIPENQPTTEDAIKFLESYFLREFGPMTDVALSSYEINTWEDVGTILYLAIKEGWYVEGPDDSIEHFSAKEERLPLIAEMTRRGEKKYLDILDQIIADNYENSNNPEGELPKSPRVQ